MFKREQTAYKILYCILVIVIALIYSGFILLKNIMFVNVSFVISALVLTASSIMPYLYFTEKGLRRIYLYLIIATFSLFAAKVLIFIAQFHPELFNIILLLRTSLYLIYYLFFAFCVAAFFKFWVVPVDKAGAVNKVFLASFLCLLIFFTFNTYLLILHGKLVFGEHIIYLISSSLDAFFIPLLTYILYIFRKSVFEESWLLILLGIVLEFLGSFGHHLSVIGILFEPSIVIFQILIIGGYLLAAYGFFKQIF
ncbi:MAG: hypothetical protein J7K82_03505 [Thermoproteales archaeon]|nr:hypothetical protein [Thermoproteales archaeon]